MEIWKEVKGYEGLYEVSKLGRVKSLKFDKEKILKPNVNSSNYLFVVLSNNGIRKTRTLHSLVAEAFLGHKPNGHELVVNHIDFEKKNNKVENLEIITARENTNQKHLKSSSQYTGVCWHKKNKKWISQIWLNGVFKHLGYFTNEIDAHRAYQKALNNIIQNGTAKY